MVFFGFPCRDPIHSESMGYPPRIGVGIGETPGVSREGLIFF
jgi:hypothetical protein